LASCCAGMRFPAVIRSGTRAEMTPDATQLED
jgi:hypothetical protein